MKPVAENESLLEDMLELEDSPVDRWKARYDEWKRMIARFRSQEMEPLNSGSPDRLQGHRQLTYVLLGHGARLAIGLLRDPAVSDGDKKELLARLDVHLSCLHTALDVWHGEPPSEETRKLMESAFAE